jgi:hypothetical protein
MRLTERHRSREEGDFAKGRGRTNTEASNRDHQDRGPGDRVAELLAIVLEGFLSFSRQFGHSATKEDQGMVII